METFLENIERYKFAIIGTVLIHVLGFFYATFATLDHPYSRVDPEGEIILPLDNVEFDPKIMEMLELNKKPQENQNITNMAVDGNDDREKSHENFSEQALDDQVEKEARDLEKEYQDYWKGTHPEENSSADIETDKNEEKTNNSNQGKNDHQGSNAVAGEVLVSFKLSDRKKHKLPRPGYTCNSSGTVVIDIKVDKAGVVKSASFNSSLSSGATECMIDKAMSYAKKSSFNYSGSAPGSQSGTITYKFVGR